MDSNLWIACPALGQDGIFPLAHTGRGADISPEFRLKNLSKQAQTLAITLEDLTHPIKRFTHWLIWNIPATDYIAAGIPAGKKVVALDGACQGLTYGWHRYAGPKPPKGKQHQYYFTIYALDSSLTLSPNTTKRQFLRAAKQHIVQQGSINGAFE